MEDRSITSTDKKKKSKKRKQRNKIILFVVELLLLALLLGALFVWSKAARIIEKIDTVSEFEDKTEAGINEDLDSETIEVLTGYTNIALFGLDNRSVGNYDAGRSDSIMIASINNKTKEVKIVSVYRDTYLSVGNGKYNKANTAYSKGGVKQAVQMLNSNLDLDITEYVCVDWAALIEAIDALGGVEIEVTNAEVKWINEYVSQMHNEIDADGTKVKNAGRQILNGAQATGYARIRYTSGDDFKRSSRQRIVLEAMLNKAKDADLATLIKICEAVFDDISTTLTLPEIINLAKDVTKYSIKSTTGFPFDMTVQDLSGSGSTVIPILLEKNVSKLHAYMFENEEYNPSFSVKAISTAIIEKTGVDETYKPINVDKFNNTAGQEGTDFHKPEKETESDEEND